MYTMYVCMCICMYACVYVCMCVYVYVYTKCHINEEILYITTSINNLFLMLFLFLLSANGVVMVNGVARWHDCCNIAAT